LWAGRCIATSVCGLKLPVHKALSY
jgi:hypothetical protein